MPDLRIAAWICVGDAGRCVDLRETSVKLP